MRGIVSGRRSVALGVAVAILVACAPGLALALPGRPPTGVHVAAPGRAAVSASSVTVKGIGTEVKGTVTDASGNPLQGVEIYLASALSPDDWNMAITGADGTYSLTELEDINSNPLPLIAGDYNVEAYSDGYVDQSFDITLADGQIVTQDFSLEEAHYVPAVRVYGNDRYGTAVAISKADFESSDVVVVATVLRGLERVEPRLTLSPPTLSSWLPALALQMRFQPRVSRVSTALRCCSPPPTR